LACESSIARELLKVRDLSFGGFGDMGNKLFVLPWTVFVFPKTENKRILYMDKKKLKVAPGFDQDAK
jgi:hypothetical protein